MEANKVDVFEIRNFLITYFEGECNIPKVDDLCKVFECVNISRLWRYDHYGPLEELTEAFLPEDNQARVHMTEYVSRLDAFYATISLLDIVKYSDYEHTEEDNQPFSPKKYNRQYRLLTVKLKLKYRMSELTLGFVNDIWKKLQSRFDLPSLTAVIDQIISG